MTRPARSALAALVAAAVASGGAAVGGAADLRRVEAVGAVALYPDAPPETPARDGALRAAVRDAVQRTAMDLLPELEPEGSEQLLDDVLGADPFEYATRFRILEDRGERPALFLDDPAAKSEYVVVVEVQVDASRVRDRLEAGGLLVLPSGETRHPPVRLVLEELDGYPSYAAVRSALIDGVRARSALPVEMQRGRAVLEVDAGRDPRALFDALRRSAPPGLRLVPLALDDSMLRLRVEHEELPLAPAPAGPASGTD